MSEAAVGTEGDVVRQHGEGIQHAHAGVKFRVHGQAHGVRENLVAGHRGARARRLENTNAAFRYAVDNRVPAVECDVRLTSDGEPVCLHDPNPGRVGGPRCDIADMSLDDVRRIQLSNGGTIPTLNGVLDLINGRAGVIVEIKNHVHEAGFSITRIPGRVVANLLDKRADAGQGDAILAVSSFDWLTVLEFRAHSRHYAECASVLSGPMAASGESLTFATRHDLKQLHLHYAALLRRPQVVNEAAHRGVDITTWTVNSPRLARHLVRVGCSTIISDDPVPIMRVLGTVEDDGGK